MANSKKMNNSNSIGNNIRKFREQHKMTQKQLSMKLSVDDSTISKYERDEVSVPPAIITDLCKVFGCTPNEFFGVESAHSEYKLSEQELITLLNEIPANRRRDFIEAIKTIVNII